MTRYDKKRHAEYELARYHRRRVKALEKLGGVCAVCETAETLEIDHIDPSQKSFSLGKLWSVSEARFEAELLKCQLLCKTHHLEKTVAEQVELAHGRWRYLKKKYRCRCGVCKADYKIFRAERWREKHQ